MPETINDVGGASRNLDYYVYLLGMLQQLQQYFNKHEVEFTNQQIYVVGYEVEYQWCFSRALSISKTYNIPLSNMSLIAYYMVIERVERIFGTVRN